MQFWQRKSAPLSQRAEIESDWQLARLIGAVVLPIGVVLKSASSTASSASYETVTTNVGLAPAISWEGDDAGLSTQQSYLANLAGGAKGEDSVGTAAQAVG